VYVDSGGESPCNHEWRGTGKVREVHPERDSFCGAGAPTDIQGALRKKRASRKRATTVVRVGREMKRNPKAEKGKKRTSSSANLLSIRKHASDDVQRWLKN